MFSFSMLSRRDKFLILIPAAAVLVSKLLCLLILRTKPWILEPFSAAYYVTVIIACFLAGKVRHAPGFLALVFFAELLLTAIIIHFEIRFLSGIASFILFSHRLLMTKLDYFLPTCGGSFLDYLPGIAIVYGLLVGVSAIGKRCLTS